MRSIRKTLPFIALVIVFLTFLPTAQAAWATTTTVPAAFRPDRDVTFTYAAQSSSGLDTPLQWRVTLHTCLDADANGWCEPTEPRYANHGDRTLSLLGGQSGSQSWIVNLPEPEATIRYHFETVCLNSPCTTQPAGGADNKSGSFELRYTDTWTRAIISTNPTQVGATQTVEYKLQSTSPDDRDLAGMAHLYSTPADEAERDHGDKPFAVNAGQQTTITWPGIDFPTIGTQQLRIDDSTDIESTLTVVVRGVHLHAIQPRHTYSAGGRFGLYFTLEGHGADPDPQGLGGVAIQIAVRNATHIVHETTLTTDADGRAYAEIATADDHKQLNWTATTVGTWLGIAYNLETTGHVSLMPNDDGGALADNVSAIRADLDELQLKGVHLDELGSRHLFLTSVRAAGAVSLVILLILFVIYVAIRV